MPQIVQFESWKQLMKELPYMDEESLRQAINYEVSIKCRPSFVARMHQRYTILHAKSERQKLLNREVLL